MDDKPLLQPDFTFEEGEEKVSVFIENKVKENSSKSKTLTLTPEKIEEIEQMHGVGLRHEDIAKVEGISPPLFKKLVDGVPVLREALVRGRARGKKNVLQSLYNTLMKSPNPAASFQWLFMFGGEKSPNRLSLTDKAGEPMPVDKLTPEDRLEAMAHLSQLLVKGGVLSSKQQVTINKENEERIRKIQENEKVIIRRVSGGKVDP